jgi:hypothetical protein
MLNENEIIKKEEAYRGAQNISINKKDQAVKGNFPELGLCNRCSSMKGIVTEFGAKKASCYIHGLLTGKHRIAKCSSFWDTSYIGLQGLLSFDPFFIDPNKEKIGF